MLFTNYGAKNILVQASSELTKSSDITIRFVMRASNNVCVFHSIYFWSLSGSIWSGRAGEAACWCWCWWPVTGRWKSLCCVVFHLLHLLSSISRAGCLQSPGMRVQISAANRLIGEVVQSRRRPLLGPSLGWKCFHIEDTIKTLCCRHWPHSK